MSVKTVLMTILRRNWRRLRQTWKLYKRSKIGLIGLAIMLGFVFIAVFAPILAPYGLDFAAPNEDVFKADFVTEPLNETGNGIEVDSLNETWLETVPTLSRPAELTLENITVYSSEGHAIRYGVNVVTKAGGAVGIDLQLNSTFSIPYNASYMKYARFKGQDYSRFYLVVANSTYYELDFDTLEPRREVDIGFTPTYQSNLWWPNRVITADDDIFCLVMANETSLYMFAKAPPVTQYFLPERFFYDSVNISIPDLNETDLEIVGDPVLILDRTLDYNGTILVVPTDKALVAYEMMLDWTPFGVRDLAIGNVTWYVLYETLENDYTTTVNPVRKHTIDIENPDPLESQTKEQIVFASNPGAGRPGQVFAFTRAGDITWWTDITVVGASRPVLNGVHPTHRQGILITGYEDVRGLIVKLNETGRIDSYLNAFSVVEGVIVTVPDYVPGSLRYILSTDQDKVYMFRENMDLDVVFSIEGGMKVPASYIGNIFTQRTLTGNYYGLVTGNGELFVQSLTGSYIAPLPPGQGASGNWYILGTDVFGHDIFTQLVYGTQNELIVGLSAAFIAVALGTLIGLVAGYFGGMVDSLLMRFTDIFLTLPILVIALLLASVLGPSLINLIIVISVFSWAGIARVIRAQTLSLKERDFIKAAKVSGAGHRQILFRHLAPNVLPFTFLYMAYTISGAIVTEAILSFLGMGDPKAITWGMMLQYLRISGHTLDAPWWFLPPGIAITLLSLSFYLIGRAFDEVVNPRLRAR